MVQRALGSVDDAFYLAEEWFDEGGKVIGKAIGLTKKQIKRKNTLLKNVKQLESKYHFTHSPLQRDIWVLHQFNHQDILDSRMKKLKTVLKRLPKKQ